mgnify:CR=1 FL=1
MDLIRLAWEAVFLSEAPYLEVCEARNPALRGLTLVVIIALLIALAGLVGTALEWATTPNLRQVQQVVLQGIQKMPWYQELRRGDPQALEMFRRQFEWGWRIFPPLFGAPDLRLAALGILLTPLSLGLIWLLYGIVAYLFARLLGGQGSLGETLGCTALAFGPYLLHLASFFPYLAVGGVVGTWALLCRYTALKTCHRLTWSRALAATLLPYVIYFVLAASFACLGIAVAALLFRGGT